MATQIYQPSKITYILSSAGFLGGLGFAFYKKSKFWGYIGWGLLGSIALGTVGGIIDMATKKTTTDKPVTSTSNTSSKGMSYAPTFLNKVGGSITNDENSFLTDMGNFIQQYKTDPAFNNKLKTTQQELQNKYNISPTRVQQLMNAKFGG